MKAPQVEQIVYDYMFPKPKSSDPQNFQAVLSRLLVGEVRHETAFFYGHLDTQEAKYPGLDYSHPPHRMRLSRFPWHRRLFRAFDNLGLTRHEIAELTKWEGTRWAKERFEKEQGIVIRNTAGEEFGPWIEPEDRVPVAARVRGNVEEMEGMREDGEAEGDGMEEDGDDSDSEMPQSVGVELNERLRSVVAQREAGNTEIPIDEEWEQWLKDAQENGGLPFLPTDLSPNAQIPGTRPSSRGRGVHPSLLNAARLGQWQQIPDVLQNIVREQLEAHNRRMEDAPIAPPAPASSSSASTSAAISPFLSRPHLTPHTRVVSGALRHLVNNNTTPDDIDTRMLARLGRAPQPQFSRRPIPPLPSARNSSSVFHSSARLLRPGSGQQQNAGA